MREESRVEVVRSVASAGALRGRVLTIGNFDGVHRGHQRLLARTREVAASLGTGAAVLTFDPAPRDVLRPDNGIPRIQTLQRKLVHLERAGIDGVVVLPFDRTFAAMEPETFASELLGSALGAVGLVVGHDFRFGRQRRGDAGLLERTLGVPVHAIEALSDEEGPVSSSRIRQRIAAGQVAEVVELLGRPHEVCGEVVQGDQRGRTLGFPTANVLPDGGMLPPDGVYAVEVETDDGLRPAVANLGHRPTFGGTVRRLEVHLFDWSGDLYGRTLVVRLRHHLRPEQRFASVDALLAQVRSDASRARSLLAAGQ